MKKHIYIKPRQTGKTSQCIQLAKRVKGKVLFIVWNNAMKVQVKRLLGDYDRSRIDILSFANMKASTLHGKKYEFVILDEYFCMNRNTQMRLYTILSSNSHRIDNLYIVSTMNERISEYAFNTIKLKEYYNISELQDELLSMSIEDITYWKNNFLTDSDSNIIKDDFFYSSTEKNKLKNYLGDEQYELEILNQFIKDKPKHFTEI